MQERSLATSLIPSGSSSLESNPKALSSADDCLSLKDARCSREVFMKVLLVLKNAAE